MRRTCTMLVMALAMGGVGACSSHPPATAPVPLEPNPTPIDASVSRTWDALVETLVDQHISTKTLSKESGLLDTGPMNVSQWPLGSKLGAATDCGFGKTLAIAQFAFLVRGDSAHSTLQVTPSYTGMNSGGNSGTCQSTGAWESRVAHAVKLRAETK
jgi:hypothetical protein